MKNFSSNTTTSTSEEFYQQVYLITVPTYILARTWDLLFSYGCFWMCVWWIKRKRRFENKMFTLPPGIQNLIQEYVGLDEICVSIQNGETHVNVTENVDNVNAFYIASEIRNFISSFKILIWIVYIAHQSYFAKLRPKFILFQLANIVLFDPSKNLTFGESSILPILHLIALIIVYLSEIVAFVIMMPVFWQEFLFGGLLSILVTLASRSLFYNDVYKHGIVRTNVAESFLFITIQFSDWAFMGHNVTSYGGLLKQHYDVHYVKKGGFSWQDWLVIL
jgi:hypothetical protein